MAVFRNDILCTLSLFVLLCATWLMSYGLTAGGVLGETASVSGNVPDPSVIALAGSALASAAICRRANRRTAMGL